MSRELARGALRKMKTRLAVPVAYEMVLGDHSLPLNCYLGQALELQFLGQINCVHCDRLTSKSFNQGFCYPCFRRLAQCDSCIMSPEKCHFHLGTCREPEWGESNCMIDHFVYLANTSGLKVGITRHSQVPTRWMDQGATQAVPIFRVSTRLQSGLVETLLKPYIADKTNWQAMLKGATAPANLEVERQRLMAECQAGLVELQRNHGLQAIAALETQPVTVIDYPVLEYPTKVKSFNFDKTPTVAGTLQGIKGQYLILDTGVINLRKFGGYQVALSLI
ncbi:DUF2797 domain-containing protein [Kineobactrum sediminis]|uniref:DUF2797 domain-containing protein n=1 Tax=Kineobactrum sediminis TaxID=1905677 RepID=A0A2N5Y2L8_9GAMM|nr:DUF2797 domain-containing protein [Kineobactrum sediminis]PLW82632.1 DUF2797 domain-containing protein [Kineobactrum sediminis]